MYMFLRFIDDNDVKYIDYIIYTYSKKFTFAMTEKYKNYIEEP